MKWLRQTGDQLSRSGVGMSFWSQEEVTIEIKGFNSICDVPNFLFFWQQNSSVKDKRNLNIKPDKSKLVKAPLTLRSLSLPPSVRSSPSTEQLEKR